MDGGDDGAQVVGARSCKYTHRALRYCVQAAPFCGGVAGRCAREARRGAARARVAREGGVCGSACGSACGRACTTARTAPHVSCCDAVPADVGRRRCCCSQSNGADSKADVADGKGKEGKRSNYQLKFLLEGHEKAVAAVKFSNCGRYLASASADKTIMLWDALTGEHMFKFVGHSHGISDVAWSSRSDFICSASDDQTVRVWDVMERSCVKVRARSLPAPALRAGGACAPSSPREVQSLCAGLQHAGAGH
jgi:hypothetical protein